MGKKRDRQSEGHLRQKFVGKTVLIKVGDTYRKGVVRQVSIGRLEVKLEDGSRCYVKSRHALLCPAKTA